MHPFAVFLSMPNDRGVIIGGTSTRRFNDGSERGYPLMLSLSTRQVSYVAKSDGGILEPKRCRLPPNEQMPKDEEFVAFSGVFFSSANPYFLAVREVR